MSIIQQIPPALLNRLLANGHATTKAIEHNGKTPILKPIIRLYVNDRIQWLLSEFYAERNEFFGLCDLGQGFPELGYVSAYELDELHPFALHLDASFKATASLMRYAQAALINGAITLINV